VKGYILCYVAFCSIVKFSGCFGGTYSLSILLGLALDGIDGGRGC
jgi:hypothetical protein